MNRMRQWISTGFLLLFSAACSAFGLRLFYYALIAHNRIGAWIGMAFLFGGMTVVPLGLAVAGNYFFPRERERFQEDLKRMRVAAPGRRIKKMERTLRHLNFAKRHPSIVFLFCIGALGVSGGMATAPAWGPDHAKALALQVMGIVLGCSYIIMLILFLRLLVTRQWESYMEQSIQKFQARLSVAKQEAGANRSATPPGL